MPILEFNQNSTKSPEEIQAILSEQGITYQRWGTKDCFDAPDELILEKYSQEIDSLKADCGYINADLIALSPQTPNLDLICKKFVEEHHHAEDEVRFVVEGVGVFEVLSEDRKTNYKMTCEAGDLIVIPKNRRHLFYLTETKAIRCIRLFKTKEGWEAIY